MKNTPKPSYKALQLENKKLVEEISQIAIKNVELEKKVAFLECDKSLISDYCLHFEEQMEGLKELNSTLSERELHFQSERAELVLALVEISNCKDLELAQEVARIALKQVNTVVKLNDKNPF